MTAAEKLIALLAGGYRLHRISTMTTASVAALVQKNSSGNSIQ
jgi:acetoin utilization deacetylase AcuC-like enzyme